MTRRREQLLEREADGQGHRSCPSLSLPKVCESRGYHVRLPYAEPSEIGLDVQALAKARDIVIEGLRAGEYTAAVHIVGRHGKVGAYHAVGRLGGEGTPPTQLGTIFDVASLTKPVATAACVLSLVEQGVLRPDQPVTDFFPERALPHLSEVTVHHLATHTSGLPAWADLYSRGQSRDEAIEELLGIPLENPLGEKHVYSCLGYILLGLIIERASGTSLDRLAHEVIFSPLQMADTGFRPPQDTWGRIAHTADCPRRECVGVGEVHDGNAWGLGGIAGNAGLFSTAPDLAVFAQMLLNGGEFNCARVLSPDSLRLMLTNQLGPGVGGQAYGFFTRPNGMLGFADSFSERIVGHTGFTGTSLLLDPASGMFVILLTNRVYMPQDGADFLQRRRAFHDAVASALG